MLVENQKMLRRVIKYINNKYNKHNIRTQKRKMYGKRRLIVPMKKVWFLLSFFFFFLIKLIKMYYLKK